VWTYVRDDRPFTGPAVREKFTYRHCEKFTQLAMILYAKYVHLPVPGLAVQAPTQSAGMRSARLHGDDTSCRLSLPDHSTHPNFKRGKCS
jgi:hypothetical protein